MHLQLTSLLQAEFIANFINFLSRGHLFISALRCWILWRLPCCCWGTPGGAAISSWEIENSQLLSLDQNYSLKFWSWMVGFRFVYFFGAMLAQLSIYNRSANETQCAHLIWQCWFKSLFLYFIICFLLSFNLKKF